MEQTPSYSKTLRFGDIPYMTDLTLAQTTILRDPNDPNQRFTEFPAGTVLKLTDVATHGPLIFLINNSIRMGISSSEFPINGIEVSE